MTAGTVRTNVFSARILLRWKMLLWSDGTSPAPRSETRKGRAARWTASLVLETWSERSEKTKKRFLAPGVVFSNTLATVWIAYRGSVVKCARSQVRPFTEDDEAAHEHTTEHMRDLGERLLHEGDFSHEDFTGQDEPPVDSPPAPEENTATEHLKPRRRMRGKTRLTSPEQPSAPTADTSPDTTQQQTKGDHDDKRRRIDEPESTVPTAAQDEDLVPCPETFDSVTRDDEIAVEWRKQSRLDHRRSLFHDLTWCTTGTAAQGGEDEPVVTCRDT